MPGFFGGADPCESSPSFCGSAGTSESLVDLGDGGGRRRGMLRLRQRHHLPGGGDLEVMGSPQVCPASRRFTLLLEFPFHHQSRSRPAFSRASHSGSQSGKRPRSCWPRALIPMRSLTCGSRPPPLYMAPRWRWPGGVHLPRKPATTRSAGFGRPGWWTRRFTWPCSTTPTRRRRRRSTSGVVAGLANLALPGRPEAALTLPSWCAGIRSPSRWFYGMGMASAGYIGLPSETKMTLCLRPDKADPKMAA